MLRDVSTAIILMELRNRINDQLSDPEPQYDGVLSEMERDDVLLLELILQKLKAPEPEEV
jgi:hypothetical protein